MNPLRELAAMENSEASVRGTEFTPGEILSQAGYWQDTIRRVEHQKRSLGDICELVGVKNGEGRIILTGAGSSHFVSAALEGYFRKRWQVDAAAYPTTSILTHPESCFLVDKPHLVISFARSGNSPESLAVYNLANQLVKRVAHVIITCNEKGDLALRGGSEGDTVVLTLHPATNDKGLAMTASFTNMLVAGEAVASLDDFDGFRAHLDKMVKMAEVQVEKGAETAARAAVFEFTRGVFLGSGPLKGIAQESALKLQELTDGTVMTAADSYLGLRHGPEAVVDRNTLVVCYISGDPYVRRYEVDLIEQLRDKKLAGWIIAVGAGISDLHPFVDDIVDLGSQPPGFPDDLSAPPQVIFGQMLGLFKSVMLGLKPDAPSVRGAIHRVVQGVEVYPYR